MKILYELELQKILKSIKKNKIKIGFGFVVQKINEKIGIPCIKKRANFFFIEHYSALIFHIHNFHIFSEKTKICIISYPNNHKY